MRCLNEECPMSEKAGCPACHICSGYKRTMTLRFKKISHDGETLLNLSPAEAVEVYKKICKIVSGITDHGNPSKYW